MFLLKLFFLNPLNLWTLKVQFKIRHKATPRSMMMIRELFYFVSVLLTVYFFFMIAWTLTELITGPRVSYWMHNMLNCLMCTIVLNKDLVNGQGTVNRYYGYKVVDAGTGMTSSPIKCMLRNVTAFMFPFEFIILQPSTRRIGDFLFGTELIRTDPVPPETILTDLKNIRWNMETILSIIFPFMLCLLFFSRTAW